MLEPRLYRVGLLPVLLAVLVVAFALRESPRSVGTTLAADAFSGPRALASLDRLADAYPVRRPGGVADAQLAAQVAEELQADRFQVRTVRHRGQTIDGARDLDLVIAQRRGTSDEQIVVVAHRDAAGPGARAELSGTAALLELARVVGAPRRTTRTLTLVSTTGGSGGAAGARQLARELRGEPVAAVIVLGSLATDQLSRPLVVGWSNDLGAAPLQLRRTVERALREQVGLQAGQPRALTQVGRFIVPGTLGEQGPLLDAGFSAVLVSTSGEAPPPADARVSVARLQGVGRAVLRAVTAIDNGPSLARGTPPDILMQGQVLPAWAPRLLIGALLLAPLLTLIDAYARLRRQRIGVGGWMLWVLWSALPFVAAGCIARLLGLTGLLPVTPAAPVPVATVPVNWWAIGSVLVVFVLAWGGAGLVRRRATATSGGDPAAPAAAVAVVGLLTAAAAAIWVGNPYAAALVVPAIHVWLFVLAPELRPSRLWGIVIAVVLVVPVLLVAWWIAQTYGLSPTEVVWVGVLSVAGGHASPLAWLLWSLVAGASVGAVGVAWRGRAHAGDDAMAITVRGPLGYAGPGSLGGVDSALDR